MTAVKQRKSDLLSPELRARIDRWTAKYPAEQKQTTNKTTKHNKQKKQKKQTTKHKKTKTKKHKKKPNTNKENTTKNNKKDKKPTGRHKLAVCTNVSCMLCGASEVMNYLEEKLGVKRGETTPDGRFTLKEVECLAACAGAPMMQVGKTFHEHLTLAKIDALLESLE